MPPLVHLSPCQRVSIPGGEVVGVGFCRGWHNDVKIAEQRCHNSDTSARCQDGDWWPRWQHDEDVLITGMLTFSARQCHWHDDDHINQGMTHYRRRPQRSITQDHRGSAIPQRTTKEHYTGPQRISNHGITARLTTILCNFLIILFIFLKFLLFCIFCFFCEFWNFCESWRFTKWLFWDPCTFVKGRQHNFHGTAIFM